MFENFLKYLKDRKEQILVFVGQVAIVVAIIYFFKELVDYLVDQSWFRLDPLLALAVAYLGWNFLRSLSKQNKIIEQQSKILEKLAKNEVANSKKNGRSRK